MSIQNDNIPWLAKQINIIFIYQQYDKITENHGLRYRGGGTGGTRPPTFSFFNIKPMGVAWKESTSEWRCPPQLSARGGAPAKNTYTQFMAKYHFSQKLSWKLYLVGWRGTLIPIQCIFEGKNGYN